MDFFRNLETDWIDFPNGKTSSPYNSQMDIKCMQLIKILFHLNQERKRPLKYNKRKSSSCLFSYSKRTSIISAEEQ